MTCYFKVIWFKYSILFIVRQIKVKQYSCTGALHFLLDHELYIVIQSLKEMRPMQFN